MARASVSGEVFLPTMISTSGIFSTGEKKCRPMKCSGRADASARPVIGRVEVLDANTASAGSEASAFLVASALTSRFSNTASTASWQSFSAPKSGVAVTRASVSSRFGWVSRPRFTSLSSSAAICALPLSAEAWSLSIRTISRPACAATVAMPEPIRPAPKTPIFL